MRELARIAVITGVVCLLLGASQLVLGNSVVGDPTTAAADSNERFAGGLLAAYGGLWIVVGRRTPVSTGAVRALALVLVAGAAGRLVSLVVTGWPHWFQIAQTVVELVVPVVVLGLLHFARGTGAATPMSPREPW